MARGLNLLSGFFLLIVGVFVAGCGFLTDQSKSTAVALQPGDFAISAVSGNESASHIFLPSGTVPEIKFSEVPGLTEYQIQVKDTAGTTICELSGNQSTQLLSSCQFQTGYDYLVFVSAKFANGETKAASNSGVRISFSSTTYGYQGVLGVAAFGPAPNAPAGTPQEALVRLSWKAFTGAGPQTHYHVIRVAAGASTLNLKATQECGPTTTTSCRACTASGTGPKSCEDANVGEAPSEYDYVIVDSASALASTYVRLRVQIPPENMVLVQRDAVNSEICALMNRTSDPTKNMRCAYTGLGATPFNRDPGQARIKLDSGYYDFGYNLFVDRFQAGCNWSPATGGGYCGASAVAGDCFGTATPTGTIGVVGNVYYETDTGSCYVKRDAATWIDVGSGSPTTAEMQLAYTVDPKAKGKVVPPLTRVGQSSAWQICRSSDDPDYGVKRLLRQREYIAAAAPAQSGEAGALTDAEITTLENGTNHPVTGACNANTHDGIALATSTAFPQGELAGDVGGSVGSVVIGSAATKNCSSRFGMQDFAGNVLQWTSDQLAACATTGSKCFARTSALDSGNTDYNGIRYDGVQGPGGVFIFAETIQDKTNANYYSVPLGLPLASNDGGNAVEIGVDIPAAKLHDDTYSLNTWDSTDRGHYVGGFWADGSSTGRWKSLFHPGTVTLSPAVGFRCAMAAETSPTMKQILYVPDGTEIIPLALDQTTGIPSASGLSRQAAVSLQSLESTPDSRFLFGISYSPAQLYRFSLGTDGNLTSLGSPQAAPGGLSDGQSLVVDLLGRFLYAFFATPGNAATYTIGSSGTLSHEATLSTTSMAPGWISAKEPTGNYVYLGEYGAASVEGFRVGANGGLTSVGQTATVGGTYGIAVDPFSRFLYVSGWGVGVRSYTMDVRTGALSQVSNIAMSGAHNVVVDPTGAYVYVCGGGGSPEIRGYSVNQSTGALTALGGAFPMALPEVPAMGVKAMTFDVTGRFLYLASAGGKLFSYSLNSSTGALTPLAGSPQTLGSAGNSVHLIELPQ